MSLGLIAKLPLLSFSGFGVLMLETNSNSDYHSQPQSEQVRQLPAAIHELPASSGCVVNRGVQPEHTARYYEATVATNDSRSR